MWMWERPDWPEFRFEEGRLADAMRRFAEADAGLVGRSEGFGDEWRRELAVELMFAEALASHAIEGEALDSESVRSSLLLALGGLSESPRRDPRIAEGGAVALILDARRHWDQPLTKQRLCAWQSMALAGGRSPLWRSATTGAARRRWDRQRQRQPARVQAHARALRGAALRPRARRDGPLP